MGVTLERVQNKFACIIGELCSEPVVLSQFAIWLDLRLAEYKAKGAISLECSGENPDPIWLKGHNFPPVRIKPRETISSRSPRSISHLQSTGRFRHSGLSQDTNRLSPDVVVVKEELSDSLGDARIFPVSLHRNDDTHPRTPLRKRTATESISSEHNLSQLHVDSNFFHQSSSSLVASSPKTRRIISSSEGVTPPLILEPVSESLMSIISGDLEEQIPETSDRDSDNPAMSSFTHPVSTSRSLQTSLNTSDTTSAQGANNSTEDEENHPSSLEETTAILTRGTTCSIDVLPFDDQGLDVHLHREIYPTCLDNANIRARIVNAKNKPLQTVKDVSKAVAMLERWAWSKYGEERRIEELPPANLDAYLTEFYQILRRPDGTDYDVLYLSKFKSYLERFLREHNYPCSLSRSSEFGQSQLSFVRRKKLLTEECMRRKEILSKKCKR